MRIKLCKDKSEKKAVIKVIGVGGGGANAVSYMYEQKIQGVEFITVNTDAQALSKALANVKVQIGEIVSKGLGAGGDPEEGRKAAEEDESRLKDLLSGTDLLFITAGMGGGTGTGGAPVVASIARSLGILTIGIVTKPFKFEGKIRQKQACDGIVSIKRSCDATIIVPNDKILRMYDKQTEAQDAFTRVDEVLCSLVRSVSEIITKQGIINRDIADLKAVLQNSGEAYIGMGESSSKDARAREATTQALNNPLFEEVSINGAGRILVTIFSGKDTTVGEIEEAMGIVYGRAGRNAHIFYGQVLDLSLEGIFRIAVIATNFVCEPVVDGKDKQQKTHSYLEPAYKWWSSQKLT